MQDTVGRTWAIKCICRAWNRSEQWAFVSHNLSCPPGDSKPVEHVSCMHKKCT